MRRRRRVRGRVARVRPRAVVRGARRRALRAGRRRGAGRDARRSISSRETLGSDERALRTWVAGRRRRRGARAGGGRDPHAAPRLGVDLPRRRCRSRSRCSSRCAASSRSRSPRAAPVGRRCSANLALLLVSGGLVAALFLIVLLLVDGWGMSPAAAGARRDGDARSPRSSSVALPPVADSAR